MIKTRLSKILFDKGWTEMELSRRTGLAQSYINRVKNARVVPTVRTALRICRALGVAVEDAFLFDDRSYGETGGEFLLPAHGAVAEPGGAGHAAALLRPMRGAAAAQPRRVRGQAAVPTGPVRAQAAHEANGMEQVPGKAFDADC